MSQEEVEKIHLASIRILEEVGVLIHDYDFVKFLSDSGVEVDLDKKRARIPAALVSECINSTPKHVVFYARDPKHNVEFDKRKIYTHPVGGAASVIDLDSGTIRPSTRKDVENLTKIVDALPNIHTTTMIVYPSDAPEHLRDIYAVEAILQNTGKNFDATPYTDESFQFIIEMIEAVTGEEDLRKNPIITVSASPTSPLQFSSDVTKIMTRATKHHIPIAVLPCPLAGATSPVTLAGTLVQQNAEMLAGVTIVQLLNSGNPVQYSPRCIPLDMLTGQACAGIEAAIMSVGCVQLAQYYGLPSDVYGLDTDSKTLDEQVAIERTMSGLLPALAGANALSGAGCIESGITVSYEQLAIDDEIFGMIFRAVKGIDFDEEKLAVDVITKVAQESSNFLQQKHTLQNFQSEYFMPKLVNRVARSRWEKMGSKSMVEIAKEKVRKILAEHQPLPIDEEIKKEIEEIVKKASKTLAP
ncbi:MAG: trimethylamine methyltransferase family protein [Candidatus Bathyarchaeota archaeon]|nr:trimethylamine methyltransferase family protein [Candidatus Bathyarchaeota archaeon]